MSEIKKKIATIKNLNTIKRDYKCLIKTDDKSSLPLISIQILNPKKEQDIKKLP